MVLKRWISSAALVALAFSAVGAPAAATPSPAATPRIQLPEAFEDMDDVPMPDPDLWQRIRLGFALDPLDSPLVSEHEEWYASRPDYIKRFVDRGSRYLHYIVEQVERRGMPTEIALLPVIESAFTPRAMSRAKASGIWQFIPSTGKNYGLTQDWWRDNRNDIVAATDAALNYLQRLHDMFGSWELALAAYNCGEGCVSRAISANQRRHLPTDYQSLKLPPETRNYVPKLFAVKNIVLSPATYGIDLESVPDQPYFTQVQAPAKIDVKVAAQLADMSVEDFLALNPAHNRPIAVAPTGTLVLPLDKADAFKENLENYDRPLVSWTTYNARRGESLDAIAKRNGVTVAQLRAVNEGLRLDKKRRLRFAGPVLVPIHGQHASAVHVAAVAAPAAAPSGSSASSATARAAQAAAAATAKLAQPGAAVTSAVRTYTVRAGDTLYAIALRFDTALEDLLEVNKLTARSVIHPGVRLKLP